MTGRASTKGFTAIEAIVVAAVIAIVGFGGWYVWERSKKSQTASTSSNSSSQTSQNNNENQKIQAEEDAYKGWQSYNNATYGISFKYPTDWKVDESPSSSSADSTTRQEYAITLKRIEEVKYNATVSVEVLDLSLDEAGIVYDRIFAQAPTNLVNRSTKDLKGRQSIQYTFAKSDTKLYLFQIEDKTCLFTSINEELNVQTDADYWTKFDKVFDSLQMTSSSE